MTRQVTDNLYIELDYFTPEEYYTYEAVAASALSTQASQACDATVILGGEVVQANGAFSSAFTQSVTATRVIEFASDVGALFSPSFTVNAIRNSFAVLDNVFTIDTTAVANRSITQTLENIANLDAQAAKTVDIISSVTATSSLTSSVSKLISASSNLVSESTLSADVFRVEFGAAALVARSNLFASRYTGTGRPRHFTDSQNIYGTGKFGVGSARGSFQYSIFPTRPVRAPKLNEPFVLEFWYKHLTTFASSARTVVGIGTSSIGGITNIHGTIHVSKAAGSSRLIFRMWDSADLQRLNFSPTTTFNVNEYYHVLMVRNSSGDLGIHINGTQVYQASGSGQALRQQMLNIGVNDPEFQLQEIDDLSFHIGTTLGYNPNAFNITVPTTRRVNDPVFTQFLYRFDNNSLDDIGIEQTAQASLSASSTLSAQAQPSVKTTAVALSANFTQSAQATVLIQGQLSVSADTALSAEVTRIQQSQADLDSVSELAATVGTVKQFVVDAGSLFTPDISVNVTVNPFATLETAITFTAQAEKTTDIDLALASDFTQTTLAVAVKDSEASAQSEFTQTANAERILGFSSTQASEFNLQVEAVKAFGLAAELDSEFTQSATATRIQTADSNISSEFAQEISAQRTRDVDSTQSSEFAQSVDYIRFRDTGSTQASEFTQSVTVIRIQQATVSLSSEFVQTANGVKDTDVLVSATAAFTQTTQAVKTVDVLPVLDSIATSLAVAVKNATGTITLESAFASTALIGKIQEAGTELGGQGVALVPENNAIAPILYLEPLAAVDTTSKFAMSFYVSENTVGRIFDGNITNQQGELGETNGVSISRSDGVYRLKYSGNTAAEQIFPYVSWRLNYTETKDYHHYLLLVDLLASGSVQDKYQLYVDGQKQIIEEIIPQYASGSLNIPLTIGNNQSGELRGIALGSNLTRTVGLWNNGNKIQQLTGDEPSLLQFWFDFNVAYDFKESGFRQKFYPGRYVDLGVDGTATGLPQPKYYVGLRDYQDTLEQGTRTTNALTNWRWAQLENFGTVSGSGVTGYFNLNAFTASEAQNSTSSNRNVVAVTEMSVTIIGVLLYGANLQSTTALVVEGTLAKGLIADLLAETAQNAQAVKTTDVISTQVSEFQQTANVGRFREIPSTLTSEFNLTGSVRFETKFEIDLFSEFTILAGVGEQQEFAGDLSSEFVFDANVTVLDPTRAEAALDSTTEVTATATRIKPLSSDLLAQAELAADVTVIPPIRIEADLASEFSLQANALAIVNNSSALSSEFTVTANVSVTVGIITAVQANAALEATVFKATGIAPTTLQVTGFVLTAGDVINFDPFLTLKIKQETRGLEITAENRVISIEQETRLNIIQGS
jgi:hypothetical protein